MLAENRVIAGDVVKALQSQGRVLLALMLREARTRYGRQRAGYLWALIEPILHMALFYAIFSFKFSIVPLGESLIIFLATGLLTYLGFANVLNRTSGGYGSNEALLSYPVVKVFDVFLGRSLLELVTWVVVTFLILGTLIARGYGPLPRSVLDMILAIVALFGIAFGAGTLLGIAEAFVPSIANVLKVPMRILYFISGAFFLPDAMPPAVRDVLAWNPVLHGITLFRHGYYPRYDSHMLDVQYLAVWSVGCVFAALLMIRLTQKPLRNLA